MKNQFSFFFLINLPFTHFHKYIFVNLFSSYINSSFLVLAVHYVSSRQLDYNANYCVNEYHNITLSCRK